MKQNILKKNFFLIVLAAVCAFVLFLCSAGADSNETKVQNQPLDANQTQILPAKQTKNLFSNDTGFTGSSAINGTEIFYKTMLAVVLVIIFGAAAVFMTKKYFPKIAKLQGREIHVIETVHLGPRKSVHLIEIGKRRLLIGSTNENIKKLADLTEFSSDTPIQENELS